MRALFLAGVAVAAIMATGPAAAADMQTPVYKAPAPIVLPSNWNGFYFGGHLGGGWGTKELSFFEGKEVVLPANVNGFLGGVQGGYNYQMGWVVLGIEGDFSWTDIKGRGTNFIQLGVPFTAKVDWTGTITGRIGGTVDHAMLYLKGGVAWAHDKYTFDVIETAHETRTGFIVGGGVEHAFTRNWSGKLEYNYMDFGNKNVNFCDRGECDTFKVLQRLHEVKVGLNYRFDWAR